jgi:hypothetical protein
MSNGKGTVIREKPTKTYVRFQFFVDAIFGTIVLELFYLEGTTWMTTSKKPMMQVSTIAKS